jgi:predicted enzyme related to lactoylglutathione lyase
MQHALSWFEISVTDRDRAQDFYEFIFNFKMQKLDINETLKMALFPVEQNAIYGALVQNSSFY